jgi:hypothetical protein
MFNLLKVLIDPILKARKKTVILIWKPINRR